MRSNVGIEALRVLAMLMIVSLHYLGFGGVIHTPDAANYNVGWLLESFSYVAVDCYVLISGYLLINATNFRFKKVFDLWLQIFFYSAGIFMIFLYTKDVPIVLTPFMPIKFKVYWFATAYLGMYLLSPYLNKMLKSLEGKEFNRLILIIIVLLAGMSFTSTDTYQVEGGYSLIWLIALYIIGAYIRLHKITFNKIVLLNVYIFSSLLTFYMLYNSDVNIYYAYNSPTVMMASVALFVFFKDLNLDVPIVRDVFRFFGKLTFGVYLIHEQPYVREQLWRGWLNAPAYYNSPDFLKHFAVSVLTVFAVCAGIEWVRQMVFGLFKKKSTI